MSPARVVAALCALAVLTLTGCSSGAAAEGSELSVSGAYVPLPMSTDMAAGFFVVSNTGGSDTTLTSVTSDLSDDVTLHKTENNQMRPVDSFSVPAGGKLTLERGANHLMLGGLKREPVVGDTVSFELHFAEADSITVQAPVQPRSYRPEG